MLVREFAAQQGVTTGVIYRHIKNHQAELEGLVIKKPKQTILTDAAQEYLKSIMLDRTVLSVTDATQAKRITELEAENKELLRQLAEARGALASAMGELGEQKALAATALAVERERDAAQAQVAQLSQQHEADQAELRTAQQEIDRLRGRSIIQRLLNK